MSSRYITISVDDGYPLDSRVADLLNKYGLQATFYIPASNPERPVMAPNQIRELSRQFEIGGHTYHHAGLKALPEEKAFAEICDGKKWLEDLLGQPVISFCYPQGKFNSSTPALRKEGRIFGRAHMSIQLAFLSSRSVPLGIEYSCLLSQPVDSTPACCHRRQFRGYGKFLAHIQRSYGLAATFFLRAGACGTVWRHSAPLSP